MRVIPDTTRSSDPKYSSHAEKRDHDHERRQTQQTDCGNLDRRVLRGVDQEQRIRSARIRNTLAEWREIVVLPEPLDDRHSAVRCDAQWYRDPGLAIDDGRAIRHES